MTVRRGPKVERERFDELGTALAWIERRAAELAHDADAHPVSLPLGRRFEPVHQVVARIELRLGRGRRAGVDVRGDGSAEAYTGWVRRRLVERRPGESAVAALRRVLGIAG